MFHPNYQQSAAIIEYSPAFFDGLKGRWAHPCGSNSMLQRPSKSSPPPMALSNDSTARGHMDSMLFAVYPDHLDELQPFLDAFACRSDQHRPVAALDGLAAARYLSTRKQRLQAGPVRPEPTAGRVKKHSGL
jgi:hypothetical protein